MFGGPKAAPPEDEILRFLADPNANAVVSLTGMPIPDRPPFFLRLLSELLEMRSRTGRPHWLILDEAHHLMPAEWLPPDGILPQELTNVVLITVHPDLLSGALLKRVDTALVVGANALHLRKRSWLIPAKWRVIDTAANMPKVSFPRIAASTSGGRSSK